MPTSHRVAMLGTGLIGDFYTMTLHGRRSRDRVEVVYSRSTERGEAFQERWGIPHATTSIQEAVSHPEVDTVVVGLPNHMHEEAVAAAAAAGKAVLVTKPLARSAAEAGRILDTVERAGVFGGYLEDLVYTPKTLKALASTRAGAVGDVLWVRSRETHPGPHSAWFWDASQAGGGASSTSAATASRSSGPSSARGTGPSRSCAGPTPWSIPSRPRTTPSP